MVMRANEPSIAAPPETAATNGTNGTTNGTSTEPVLTKEERKALKSQVDPLTTQQIEENRKRVREKTEFEDLAAPAPKKTAALNLAKVER